MPDTKADIRPCRAIAAQYLGVAVRELPPGLAWRLMCADDRLREMGTELRSRQAVAAIIFAWFAVGDCTQRTRFLEPMPEGFWSDVCDR